MNIVKFLRTPILKNNYERLLLYDEDQYKRQINQVNLPNYVAMGMTLFKAFCFPNTF